MYSYHIWTACFNYHIWTACFKAAMMAKPIRALELHYPLIQFLVIFISHHHSLTIFQQYFTKLVTSKKTFLTSAIFYVQT